MALQQGKLNQNVISVIYKWDFYKHLLDSIMRFLLIIAFDQAIIKF